MKESEREEGVGLCIQAHGGEVASEGSIEEPRGVALLPVVGNDPKNTRKHQSSSPLNSESV